MVIASQHLPSLSSIRIFILNASQMMFPTCSRHNSGAWASKRRQRSPFLFRKHSPVREGQSQLRFAYGARQLRSGGTERLRFQPLKKYGLPTKRRIGCRPGNSPQHEEDPMAKIQTATYQD